MDPKPWDYKQSPNCLKPKSSKPYKSKGSAEKKYKRLTSRQGLASTLATLQQQCARSFPGHYGGTSRRVGASGSCPQGSDCSPCMWNDTAEQVHIQGRMCVSIRVKDARSCFAMSLYSRVVFAALMAPSFVDRCTGHCKTTFSVKSTRPQLLQKAPRQPRTNTHLSLVTPSWHSVKHVRHRPNANREQGESNFPSILLRTRSSAMLRSSIRVALLAGLAQTLVSELFTAPLRPGQYKRIYLI